MSVFDFCQTLNIKCFFKPCGCFPLSNSALLAEALVNFYLVFLMSQSSSESDIWEYRSLKKTKRPANTKVTKEHGGKRRRDEQGTSNKRGKAGRKDTSSKVNAQTGSSTQRESVTQVSGCKSRPDHQVVSPEKPDGSSLSEQDPQSKGFCPVCQMPFFVLMVQSAQWHVAECLETPGETTKECPDGLRCSSSIPNHYKRYSHSLLAHSRAVNSIDSSILDHTTSHLDQTTVNSDAFISIKESSGDSAVNLSGASSQSASPTQRTGESNTPGCPNALQLLRSPGLDDIKKRKGWYPASKSPRSQKSQDDKILISTPIKTGNHVSEVKEEPTDEYISYSPLSELPADLELNQTKKRLFCSTALQEVDIKVEDSNSLLLFNDTASDDDLFADVLDQYESDQSRSQEDPVGKESLYTCNQLEYIQSNEHVRTSSSVGGADGPCQFSSSFRHSKDEHLVQAGEDKHQLPSPQSLVLERLRKCISNPAEFNRSCSAYADTKPDSVNQAMPSTRSTLAASKKQNLTITPKKAKPKAGTLGLKQTDIGVFFGLKPLKEEVKPKVAENLQVSSGTAEGSAKRQNRWRRKSTAVSEATMTTAERKDGAVHPTQTEGDTGMKPRGWKRWNRGRATDGVAEEPKRCPFYKKIPGTSFAVDAFQYGTIKGITAYFLTHFHSDHYGGLKKNSTLPIYCNKITGNLVKSKLKVDEQYVHILPMKEECTVDGVKVILLDANHCPGSAMLLFLLPDGQTVLHTGDFRADPSMERYPELQSIRIQTLYLDTTYCSPEYTFPTQQEVISFAANTAFELVTLNPRTLVVCGTYSVGKEKVFLAVSQVLGSKVYMSRDRYNTMCCLESEEICQFITTDMKLAQVHVLPMMQLNFKNLKPYLSKFSGKYDQLVAFKPTGWTFTPTQKVEDIHPQVKDNISIYGIPYSEHSSYLELKRFVQWLRPLKIIPTVNVGSWNSRKAMNEYFNEWQAEVKAVTTVSRNNGCSSTRQ